MAWKSFFVATLSIGLALTPPAGAQGFIANLSAGQTVPRANSQASGSCSAVLLEEVLELSISCEHNVENVFAAHIHLGQVGEAGPIILPFDDPEEIEGVFELSDEEAAFLLTESFYVNVHSAQSPPGEIRGQLRFQSTQETDGAFFVPLSGGQVVPPVATQASGRCLAELDEEDGGLELSVICHHSVQNPVAAHIHQGAAGDNGPIVVPLGNGASPIVVDDMQVSQEIAD
ncbi:MAG: CHRD domain-containing protein, partial [Thermoanaerobaculia bacterium]